MVTLLILAAVTILVVGLYGIVSRESQTSASYEAVDQADLAIQSGLDHASLLLKNALSDELGVIFSAPLNPAEDDKQRSREMLVAANFDTLTKQWKYQPLASGVARPPAGDKLTMPFSGFEKRPAEDPAIGPSVDETPADARRLPIPAPWQARVPRYWMQLRLPNATDQAGGGAEGGQEGEESGEDGEKLVARYSFYVEDLQGKLSLANAGMHDTDNNVPFHQAANFDDVVPAIIPKIPGLIIDPKGRWRRSPASVWTLLRPDLEPMNSAMMPASVNSMHRRLTAVNSKRLAFSPDMWRELLVAPDPLTNWPGIDALRLTGPDARLENGSLADTQLRALEENTTGYLTPYDELALVPHSPGFEHGGDRKLNLNRILHDTGGDVGLTDQAKMQAAVIEMAEHINRHLPEFSKRAGGYPLPRSSSIDQRTVHKMAYLKCLAAGIIDYADKDGLPSINLPQGGAGDESAEGNIEYRGTDSSPLISEYWQRYRFERFLGREAEFSLTDFAEIWNPTNQTITGQITCCFEYKGRMSVGFRSYPVMSTVEQAIRGMPATRAGLQGRWFEPQTITLKPNEIQVIAFPAVVFRLDGGEVGNATGVDYYGQPANGNDDRESRYRLAFQPEGASSFTVVDMPLAPVERYYKNANLTYRQRFNVSQPGLAYRLRQKGFAWIVGDTRASYFIDYNQEEISYEGGSSPWGRNYRRFNDPTDLPGESRPFLFPDGGHNTIPCPTPIGSYDRNPDDISMRPKDNPTNSEIERQKFIQPISNSGRFYSPTEIGNVFDPIMWDPNGKGWFDEEVLYSEHADLKPSVVRIDPTNADLDAHKRFCGGNSLRIGRAEHSLFRPDYRDKPDDGRPRNRGLAATSLLDLFHVGDANSDDSRQFRGDLVRIDGHVNVNTASKETLRALVAGRLGMDPLLKKDSEQPEPTKDKRTTMLPPSRKRTEAQADVIATSIIQNRPYVTPAEVAEKAILSPQEAANLVKDGELLSLEANMPVFGYTKRDPKNDLVVQPEWTDAAAEELFGRLWNNSTVRSRHFKVVVCGQTVKVGREGRTNVVATRSRVFHVFVRPVRGVDGSLEKQVVEVMYSRAL